MAKIYFLSHSSEDGHFVKQVASRLGKERCWLYEWEIRPGDSIFEFDRGIADSRVFVLFWSVNATKSPWVPEEVSQARIRMSRDRGFRLVTVKLDNTSLPVALAHRSWIDGTRGIFAVVNALQRLEDELTPEETYVGKPVLRNSFQNREDELDLLERWAFSSDSPVMILGIDGIGKTSLMKKAIVAIFSHLTPIWVDMDVASTPIRLISTLAKPLSIQVDPHYVREKSYDFWRDILLPEIGESDKLFVIFDNLEVASVAGYSRGQATIELVEKMCGDLVQIHKNNNPGVIVLTWNEPPFDVKILNRFKTLELGSLDDKSIARALRFHLSYISPLDYDLQKLEQLAGHIGGYPAAISTVARRVAQQGIDAALADLDGLRNLRFTIAEDLFAHVPLSSEERDLLILLATSTYPLLEYQMKYVAGDQIDSVESIRRKQLLDPTSQGYSLHSVLRDYVLESMSKPEDIIECHHKLAHFFDREWKKSLPLSAERAEFVSLCYFHTIASRRRRQARIIEIDYLEEAKAAAVELYRRGEYKTALKYLETAKKMDGKTDPIYDFYYGLSLNRLGRSNEALEVIENLLGKYPQTSRYHHAKGTILRHTGDNENALRSFRKAVSLSSERGRVTALCSLADLLSAMGNSEEAIPFVEEALNIEPGKSFVVATASKVYDDAGKVDTALKIILEGLRISPEDTRLHHRAGMILKEMRYFKEARKHLEKAAQDPALGFSVTALADTYLELDRDIDAEETLERYPGNKQRSPSYLSTKANILRRRKDFKSAEALLRKAIKWQPQNMVAYGIIVQTKIDEARQFIAEGDTQLALLSIDEAKNYVYRGLQIQRNNETLLSEEHEIRKIELELSA